MKCTTGTKKDGPSFCWHCGRMLHRAPGKGLGLFFFATHTDRQGLPHRVHGRCANKLKQETP